MDSLHKVLGRTGALEASPRGFSCSGVFKRDANTPSCGGHKHAVPLLISVINLSRRRDTRAIK